VRRFLGILRSPVWRIVVVLVAAAGLVALVWWRGPDWGAVWHTFDAVEWHWVVIAIGLNLLSVVVRALAWNTVIKQAIPPPHPRFQLVFSAFSVGLFANAVLPGRIGELSGSRAHGGVHDALEVATRLCVAKHHRAEGATIEPGFGDPAQFGELLLKRFLIPFEAASYLLLIAAVGAVVLARRRRGLEHLDEEHAQSLIAPGAQG